MRQQYEPSADRIIALYQQLEDDILSAVIRRILKMGYVSEASKHQLEVLQAAGLLYDDIVQLIADRTDACTAQVKALFEDAGVQTVAIDNSLHEAAGALPIDIRQFFIGKFQFLFPVLFPGICSGFLFLRLSCFSLYCTAIHI